MLHQPVTAYECEYQKCIAEKFCHIHTPPFLESSSYSWVATAPTMIAGSANVQKYQAIRQPVLFQKAIGVCPLSIYFSLASSKQTTLYFLSFITALWIACSASLAVNPASSFTISSALSSIRLNCASSSLPCRSSSVRFSIKSWLKRLLLRH